MITGTALVSCILVVAEIMMAPHAPDREHLHHSQTWCSRTGKGVEGGGRVEPFRTVCVSFSPADWCPRHVVVYVNKADAVQDSEVVSWWSWRSGNCIEFS